MRAAPPLRWAPSIVAVAGAATLLILSVGSWQSPNSLPPWRLEVAGGLAAMLLFVAAMPLVVAPFTNKWSRQPTWETAVALTGIVAAVGLTIVGLYGLFPPPLEYSRFRAWEYHDKRWLILLYLLGCGLVYLPAVFRRLLGGGEAQVVRASALPNSMLVRRTALAVAIGTLLAVLYMAPFVPFGLERFIDPHEQVHLGGFQRIAQGAAPYLGARTQYGPGYQLLTYWLMERTGLTLYGFRLSQAWLNLAGAALLFSLWLGVYGPRRGAAILVASLALSPLLIVTWWGWGLVLRWVGPVLVGALVPPLIWSSVTERMRTFAIVALALACGVLAWLAQENLTGPIMAMLLLLTAAYARGVLSLAGALRLAGIFIVTQLTTLALLMLASFGPGAVADAMSLYFHSTGLVFQGMTNTNWDEPQSTWRRAYPATPFVIMLLTGIALYRWKTNEAGERENGQLLGMAAAAVPLTMITLFRSDGAHFVATSTALAPLVILAIVILPGPLKWRIDRSNALRLVLITVAMFLYFYPKGNYVTRISNSRSFADPRLIGNPRATIAGLSRLTARPRAVPAGDPVLAKLGFVPAPDARCCYIPPWSWSEWNATMRDVHRLAAGRSVFVDVALPLESSGIAFLADLRPSSSYVSEIMSVWTDEDVRTITTEFRRRPPDCILSKDRNAPLTAAALSTYGRFTVSGVPGPVGLTLYCKNASA
jgi:hypothetical protein